MLALLMLAMGLTITPRQLSVALRTAPRALAVNLGCCFVVAPLLTLAVSALLRADGPTRVGLVLLGCVSGGQASNLCALIAGGDVALSIVLTLSTTLVGVVATPLLVGLLLGGSVPVDALRVLRSTATLVLAPLLGGLAFVSACPRAAAAIAPACPAAAVVATLSLVAGGAANAAGLTVGSHAAGAWKAHAGAIITPLVACAAAARISSACGLRGAAVRTVAIETLVKSPTVAYVLAVTHFGAAAAVPPAAAMVWLAALGAGVALVWGKRGISHHS
jgi:BASS family bile acid:Na+ symporter